MTETEVGLMSRGTGAPSPEGAEDRTLVARIARDGDEVAFRTLYRRHTPYLLRFVLRILGGSEEDAEEVIQDVWIRAARGFEGFQWKSTLRTWLTGIALNRARETLRRRKRLPESLPEALPDPGPPPRIPDRIDLERAIAALPDGYRTVLVLHDVEGFTHPEIGRRLDIAVGTSRSQLHHARRAVRRALRMDEREDA